MNSLIKVAAVVIALSAGAATASANSDMLLDTLASTGSIVTTGGILGH